VCASTRGRSDFKERRDAFFLAFIGFPHAKDVSGVASGHVPDNHHAASEQAVADDARLAVVLALVLDFKRCTSEHLCRVLEVEAPIRQCP